MVAEGPEWSGTPEAWDKLRDTIGGAVGDKVEGMSTGWERSSARSTTTVRATSASAPDHALLRFHDHSLLGTPVALGHHYYGIGRDAKRLEDAWQSLLTEFYPAQ